MVIINNRVYKKVMSATESRDVREELEGVSLAQREPAAVLGRASLRGQDPS